MNEEPLVQRRLVAILAADIAGYSRLMGEDDAATVCDLKGHQAVILPLIGRYGGRIIDTAGRQHPCRVSERDRCRRMRGRATDRHGGAQ